MPAYPTRITTFFLRNDSHLSPLISNDCSEDDDDDNDGRSEEEEEEVRKQRTLREKLGLESGKRQLGFDSHGYNGDRRQETAAMESGKDRKRTQIPRLAFTGVERLPLSDPRVRYNYIRVFMSRVGPGRAGLSHIQVRIRPKPDTGCNTWPNYGQPHLCQA